MGDRWRAWLLALAACAVLLPAASVRAPRP